MSFTKSLIDYGEQNFPQIQLNQQPYLSSRQESVVYNDKTYKFYYYILNTSAPSYQGIKYSMINQNIPVAIYKSVEQDIFLIIRIYETSSGSLYIRYYLNSNPTLENATTLYTFIPNKAYMSDNYFYFIGLTDDFIGVVISQNKSNGTLLSNALSISELNKIMGKIESKTFSDQFGNASNEEGYEDGTFDDTSDIIEIPKPIEIGVTNVGFINVYRPTLNNLVNFGSELFPSFESPTYDEDLTDIADSTALEKALAQSNIYQFNILKNLYNSFANSKLIDFVLDCHCIPVTPPITSIEKIKVGYKEFETQSPKVSSDYVIFDCGTLNIGEYYNNFIDYTGTRAKLFLPFVGFVDIQNEYFQNGTLQVIYKFNIIDGSFMAYVLSSSSKSQLANTVIASYGGNACVHLPITSLNYSTMISSVLNGTAGVISGLTHGNPIGALNSAMNTLSAKPSMQSSNGYNSSSAYLGIRCPYLVIEREVSNFSEKYTNENGLPCNITKTINELTGFIQMDNMHMETLSCTEEEKAMIEDLLKNGIIV